MALGDFLAKLGGRDDHPSPEESNRPPTSEELLAALAATEDLVSDGAVPSPVTARVERVTHTVRDTIPRLDTLGAGSASAYSVMATATDYLPEAVGGYLRLPRRFADTRPVDDGKTSLMVLVDQLDLLGATMDRVFDAVCRDDATELVVHGRFLAEKFGTASSGGALGLATGETPLPAQPVARANPATGPTAAPPSAQAVPAQPAAAPPPATASESAPPVAPTRLAPPSSLDL